jgi:LDH2 family malate/lactate/ureidoglycolate dehydrogenase
MAADRLSTQNEGTQQQRPGRAGLEIEPARETAMTIDRATLEHLRADFTAWVKSARTVAPDGEILMPGEPEHRSRIERLRNGIPLDATTWKQTGVGFPEPGDPRTRCLSEWPDEFFVKE